MADAGVFETVVADHVDAAVLRIAAQVVDIDASLCAADESL
jgi:hypothetical protein